MEWLSIYSIKTTNTAIYCNISQYIAMCNISIFPLSCIVLYCSIKYCNISIYCNIVFIPSVYIHVPICVWVWEGACVSTYYCVCLLVYACVCIVCVCVCVCVYLSVCMCIYQGLQKLWFTISHIFYMVMPIAMCQEKFIHIGWILPQAGELPHIIATRWTLPD